MANMALVWITAGSLVVAIITLIIAYSQKKGAERKIRDEQQQENGKTSEVLREIDTKLKNLDEKTTRSETRMENFFERLVVVEQSTKSAHKRIDDLEKNNKKAG